MHNSEFPELKYLMVLGCDKIVRFASEFSCFLEKQGEGQHGMQLQQPLFLVEKVWDIPGFTFLLKVLSAVLSNIENPKCFSCGHTS